ncbi:hypothetical protein D1007_20353 [Hordeum vulgare]|nr:hypothetical protein D1007_20353 [Hordeum vulgare]
MQSPCSVITAFAVGEKNPLPSGLAPAWTSSRSSKEVLAPDDVVRTPRPPMVMSCVSAADDICSIDDDDELAMLTLLAARRIQSSKCMKEKSFPLYEALGVLYEGRIAQGRHCLASRKPSTVTKSGSNFRAKEKMVASTSKINTRDRSDDSMRTPSIIDINYVPALDDADGDAERDNTVRDEEEFGSEDADGDHPQISLSSVLPE